MGTDILATAIPVLMASGTGEMLLAREPALADCG
jgi:hypothetical protein